jgi:hypothetical protein
MAKNKRTNNDLQNIQLIIVDLYQIDATHMVLVDRCEIQSSNITNTTQRFGLV